MHSTSAQHCVQLHVCSSKVLSFENVQQVCCTIFYFLYHLKMTSMYMNCHVSDLFVLMSLFIDCIVLNILCVHVYVLNIFLLNFLLSL